MSDAGCKIDKAKSETRSMSVPLVSRPCNLSMSGLWGQTQGNRRSAKEAIQA